MVLIVIVHDKEDSPQGGQAPKDGGEVLLSWRVKFRANLDKMLTLCREDYGSVASNAKDAGSGFGEQELMQLRD